MNDLKATIIYLKDDMVISKRQFKDWREAQSHYGDEYKASMEPMTVDEVVEFLEYEYGADTMPFTADEVKRFFASDSECIIKQ